MPISEKVTEQIKGGSWIRKMFEEGIRLKKEVGEDNVFDFTLGNPNTEPPEEFFEALEKVVAEREKGVHVYMQNPGFIETRRRVARDLKKEFGVDFTHEDIIMTVGAAGALNVIFKTILDQDDEVILIAPYFVEYNFYVDNHGGRRVTVGTNDDFSLNVAAVEEKITKKTRAVLINSPCNPSGRLFSGAGLKELGEMLAGYQRKFNRAIYIVSDEPYRRLLFDGKRFNTPLHFHDNVLVATSFSKDLSLAGERIGYIAISPNCRYKNEIFDGAAFNNRTLGYINAPAIMQRVIAVIGEYKVNVEFYRKKRDRLYDALTSYGYKIIKPDGTFYMFPKSPIPDDIAFIRMLQARHVLTSPGSGFSCPGYFRISYCTSDEAIERALPIFRDVINSIITGR